MTIRNLDERVKQRLQVRAARHGRSMEAEIRAILTAAAEQPDPSSNPLEELRERFEAEGGVGLGTPERRTPPRAPDLP